MNITEALIPVNKTNRPGIKNTPKKICVHYNGGPCSGKNLADYFYNNATGKGDGRQVSSHYVIGQEGEIYRIIPDGEISYCASNNNRDILHIECCHPDSNGKFTAATEAALSELVRSLMSQYNIPAEMVVRHYDLTGKHCPLWYVTYPAEWKRLHTLITGGSSAGSTGGTAAGSTAETTTEQNVIYRVIAGAFYKKANAERFVAELKLKGYSPYIQAVKKEGK